MSIEQNSASALHELHVKSIIGEESRGILEELLLKFEHKGPNSQKLMISLSITWV